MLQLFLTVLALDSDFHFIMRRSETLKVKPVPEDQLLIDFRAPDVGENQLGKAMSLACQAALRGIGFVRANPPVGAVLVDAAHRFLAVGAHLDYGHSHAEVNVFDKLLQGASLKNATLYVTLEPCSHNGKTPACATMLLGRSLRKIVVASLDPNPLVNGQGRKILENSGCLFEVSSKFAEMASDLHESFIWNIQHSLPLLG